MAKQETIALLPNHDIFNTVWKQKGLITSFSGDNQACKA